MWRTLVVAALGCGACVARTVAPVVSPRGEGRAAPTAGLVAWYALDGNAEDASNADSPAGALAGAVPTTDRCGRAGGAYDFTDGASIAMPDNPRLPVGAAPRTLAIWLRVRPEHFAGIALNWGTVAPRQRCSLQLQASTGLVLFSGESSDVASRSRVGDGAWHFVAATYDGARATLYVDGAPEGHGDMTLATAGRALAIARLVPSDPRPESVTGALDDARVYDRALGADEIVALYRERGCAP